MGITDQTLAYIQTLRNLRTPDDAWGTQETYQTYDDLKDRPTTFYPAWKTGHLCGMEGTLITWSGNQGAIHLMLNSSDGLGRSKGNVTAIVGVWGDLDVKDATEPIDLDLCPIRPTMAVASSPEGRHIYWLFHEPMEATLENLDRAEAVMRGIVANLAKWGCDPACAEVARVLRLPGFINRKPEHNGYVVNLLWNDGPRYTWEQLEESFPPVKVVRKPTPQVDLEAIAHISTDQRFAKAAAYLNSCEAAVEGAGGSNACIKAAGRCFSYGLTAEETMDLLRKVYNPRCSPPWFDKELAHKVDDAEKFAQGNGTFGSALIALASPAISFESRTIPGPAPALLAVPAEVLAAMAAGAPAQAPSPAEVATNMVDPMPDEAPKVEAEPNPEGAPKVKVEPAPKKSRSQKECMVIPITKDPDWDSVKKMRSGELKMAFPYQTHAGEILYYRIKREVIPGEPLLDYLTLWFNPKSANADQLEWRIGMEPKGLQLYGLPRQKGIGRVLLVEGEEMADLFAQLMPNMKVLGAPLSDIKKVLKTDWSILKGEDVIIFIRSSEAGLARGCARAVVSAEAKKVWVCPTAEIPENITTQWIENLIALATEFTMVDARKPYEILEGAYHLVAGDHPGKLCNFTAILKSTIRYIDGYTEEGEILPSFEVSGATEVGVTLGSTRITADQLSSANWFRCWEPHIDFNHTVQYAQKHVVSAIKQFSGGIPPERVIYKHVGWAKINGQDVYLHNTGCITANGELEGVKAELHPASPHRGIKFNRPQQGMERQRTIRKVLSIFEKINHDYLTTVMLGFPLLSTFGGASFGVQLKGPTGVGKSGIGAIMANFFDPIISFQKHHQSWREVSEANLGLILFDGKDCLTAIDDFEKDDSPQVTQKRVTLLEGALWALGGTSKGRNTSTGEYRTSKPCRTSLVLTGQDTCLKKSGVVRMLIVDVPPLMESGRRENYLEVAGWGQAGVLNDFMGCWLQHMAAHRQELLTVLSNATKNVLEKLTSVGHARANTSLASILAVWVPILAWAVQEGAITEDESSEFRERIFKGCINLQESTSEEVDATDPVNNFLKLPSLLRSQACHLTDCRTGSFPVLSWGNFGWSAMDRACGPNVGYINLCTRKIYLEETAFSSILDTKLHIGHEWRTFKKLLNERGLLIDKAADGGLKSHIPGNHGRGYCISMDSFKDWTGPDWDQIQKDLLAREATEKANLERTKMVNTGAIIVLNSSKGSAEAQPTLA